MSTIHFKVYTYSVPQCYLVTYRWQPYASLSTLYLSIYIYHNTKIRQHNNITGLLPFKCSCSLAGCHFMITSRNKKHFLKWEYHKELEMAIFICKSINKCPDLLAVVNELCNRLSVTLIFIIWGDYEMFKINVTSDYRNVQFTYNLIP